MSRKQYCCNKLHYQTFLITSTRSVTQNGDYFWLQLAKIDISGGSSNKTLLIWRRFSSPISEIVPRGVENLRLECRKYGVLLFAVECSFWEWMKNSTAVINSIANIFLQSSLRALFIWQLFLTASGEDRHFQELEWENYTHLAKIFHTVAIFDCNWRRSGFWWARTTKLHSFGEDFLRPNSE